MHCFRRAVSRLQISSAVSPSSTLASRSVPRSTCSTPITAAARFAYPSMTQTRWNSTDDDPDAKKPFQYAEAITPEGLREGKSENKRQYVSEGPVPKTTVYVGNLFYDVTAEDLRKHFEKYGVVENALIVHDARGLSKGFGYVSFNTVEEATEAITQKHGGIMEGREVVVHFANTRYKSVSNIEPTKTLHIGNMPYEMTDQDIQELFEDIPGMIDVRIPVDRRTGLPRGFAHVDFAEQADASHAKEVLSRRSPYERKLRVSFAKRKILTPDDYQRYQDKKLAKRTAARAQRQD